MHAGTLPEPTWSYNEMEAGLHIPFKKGTTGKANNAPTWKKMYHYFESRNEEFFEHYSKPSNA